MTPRQLLALKPERVSHDLYSALNHTEADHYDIEPETDERIEVREYKHVDFDGTRNWWLGSVWFDGRPVLIFQEAGRSRSDHYEKWIVDPDAYWDLVKYSYTLPRTEDAHHNQFATDLDKEMGDELTSFYGCTLEQMREYKH